MKNRKVILFFLSLLFLSPIVSSNNIKNENKIEHIDKKNVNESQTEMDKSIVNTYNPSLNVLGRFTTIAKIDKLNDLKKYSVVNAKPSSVIIYINSNLEVINEQNNPLNISLKDAYEKYIKGKMIPLIYIKDEITLSSFIEYYPSNMNLLDMGVVSNNPNIVKEIRETNPNIRGIIDYSSNDNINEKNLVKEANMSYANSVILNNKQASSDVINYIQARLKTVWVEVDEKSTIDIITQINNGAAGLIANNTDYIYSATNVYLKTDNPIRNLNRVPYIVAHRGVITNYENSLEGCIEAYEYGATHLEIDIQLTKDNKLAIMHDSKIDRTTTGTGAISDYTYDELKQFKIDSSSEGKLNGEGVNIPLLNDFLDYFMDKEVVLVVEFKTTSLKAVEVLKDLLKEYNAYDKVVLITFYPAILKEIKEKIPEVPLSSLGSISITDFATGLEYVNNKNSAVNTTKDNSYKELSRYLIDRGFLPWHWTYENIKDVQKAFFLGAQGITNDCIKEISEFKYKLVTDKDYIEVDSFENINITLECLSYGNKKENVTVKPLYLDIDGNEAMAVFYYSYDTPYDTPYNYCIFSDVIKLIKK